MIVVDTNVIAYFWLPGTHTSAARAALQRDAAWTAPALWRTEFRNVLSKAMRGRRLKLKEAIEAHGRAIQMMRGSEFELAGDRILELTEASTCSAYDCEFVALAEELEVPLVTADRRVLKAFPALTVALKEFAGE